MFGSEARAYLTVVPHFRVGLWSYQQTLDKAGKACPGKTFYLKSNIHKNIIRKQYYVN
jgi:hypothetical protein